MMEILGEEERLESAYVRAFMQAAHQVKFARAVGKSVADLVEELTCLFPMQEKEADEDREGGQCETPESKGITIGMPDNQHDEEPEGR